MRENDPEEMVPKIDKRQKEKLSQNREELLHSTQEYRQRYENFQSTLKFVKVSLVSKLTN